MLGKGFTCIGVAHKLKDLYDLCIESGKQNQWYAVKPVFFFIDGRLIPFLVLRRRWSDAKDEDDEKNSYVYAGEQLHFCYLM
jgi:hypothetical protein